jgi:glycine hydroxymethyltransferase
MKKAIKKVQNAVFPLTTSNTHLGRLPALGLVALEMKLYGEELAKQTVKNAQTAGEYLFENRLQVLGEEKGFTRSHQIAVDVQEYGGGGRVAESLEQANIILNKNLLPYDDQHNRENPSGIRVGFQDITRRGFKESDVKELCDLMLAVVKDKRKPLEVRKDVIKLRKKFNTVKYGFQSVKEVFETLSDLN